MRTSAQSKSGLGRFDPDLIVVLDWLCKPVVALGATTKSYDNWSGHLRPRPLVGFVCNKKVGWAPRAQATLVRIMGWARNAHPTFM